jgi:autotransporter passenger strand-loop-strand repeat protein
LLRSPVYSDRVNTFQHQEQKGNGVTTINGGQILTVSSGQTDSGTVLSGGDLVVSAGGSAGGTTIESGGSESVLSRGTDGGAIINGGTLELGSGAAGSGAITFAASNSLLQVNGAVMPANVSVQRRGTASWSMGQLLRRRVIGGRNRHRGDECPRYDVAFGATVSSGQTFTVSAGQTETSLIVLSGGTLNVLSGGIVINTLDSGGAVNISSGGATKPDQLDLKDIAFGTGTSATFTPASGGTSGTLTVTDGAHTANIELLGQYTAGQFTATSDNNGGTIISDPPPGVAASEPTAVLASPHHT